LGSRSDDALIIAGFMAKFRVQQPSVNPGEQQQFSGLSLPLSAIEALECSCSSPVRFESMEHNWFSSPFVTLSPEKHAGCCLKGIEKAVGPWIPLLSLNQQSAMTILSFLKSEIRTNIVIELFSVIRMLHAPQPIAIAARVAPLGSHYRDRREFQGHLEIHAADILSVRLPLKFTFGLIPCQAVIVLGNSCLSCSRPISHVQSNRFPPEQSHLTRLVIPHFNDDLRPAASKKSQRDSEVSEHPFCRSNEIYMENSIARETERVQG
jgi:hypothetical protein